MNKFKVTNRSLLWELTNSAWIIFSFIGLGFISFFIIGKKARQKKWTYCGIGYFILLAIGFGSFATTNTLYIKIGGPLYFISVFVPIIHCFVVRNKYLICRDIILNANLDVKAKKDLKDQILKEYEDQGIISSSDRRRSEMMDSLKGQAKQMSKQSKVKTSVAEEKESEQTTTSGNVDNSSLLDINNCSIEELTALPGITVIKAKKAENYRNEKNGFSSVDEFFKVVDLQPHFVIQLEGKLTCSPVPKASSADSKDRKGRVLDF